MKTMKLYSEMLTNFRAVTVTVMVGGDGMAV